MFDRCEQLAELTDEQRGRLRAVILSHDNDPIAVMGPDLIVQRPPWLADGQRGRGVPEQMRWRPLVTFVQTAMDAANAMVSVPGEFGSFGHDYRADMVRFVRDAYALPAASDAQVARIEEVLRSLELERAPRIKARNGQAVPPPPAHRPAWTQLPASRSAHGVPAAPGGSEDDSRVQHPRPPVEGEPAAWSTPERC